LMRAPEKWARPTCVEDFCTGARQLAADYRLYGPFDHCFVSDGFGRGTQRFT